MATATPAQREAAPTAAPMATATKTGGRILALDVLRIAAAFAVVYIHTSASVVLIPTWLDLHRPGWILALVVDSAARWCVPSGNAVSVGAGERI